MMHEDIDPSNLGPPVYKYDQIITVSDIKNMMIVLGAQMEDQNNTEIEEDRYETVIRVLEILIVWVNSGKPEDMSLGGYNA